MVCVLVIKQDSFPSLAIFEFNDFFGVTHSFCEKIPVLGIEIKEVPYFAWIECIVIEKKNASLLISTHKPNGVESESGQFEFEVASELVTVDA